MRKRITSAFAETTCKLQLDRDRAPTERLRQVTGVACYVAENPLYCVAKGTGLALEHFDFFKKSLVPVQ